jgi:DNA polymerase IV
VNASTAGSPEPESARRSIDTVLSRAVMCIDMDAFYVSCELKRRPELRGLPVVVGGDGLRGVVAASSYEARQFGVRSAMGSGEALRRCPKAILIPGDHRYYAEQSALVHEFLAELTWLIEPLALDEAFVDLTAVQRRLGPAGHIARTLRQRVADELGLPCSIGIAPTKLAAKLASEAAKPVATMKAITPGPGVVVVTNDALIAFLHRHRVEALWGVGPATLTKLQRVGVRTVADVVELGEGNLVHAIGESHGRGLYQQALGIDDRPVVPDREAKSIGQEETFAFDRHGIEELAPELVRHADHIASRLRRYDLRARTISIKVRYPDFRTITRSVTVNPPTDSGEALVRHAKALLANVALDSGIRLFGLSTSQFVRGDVEVVQQMSFDDVLNGDARTDTSGDGRRRADSAVDAIRERFGTGSIGPATLVRPGSGLTVQRHANSPWGPEAIDGNSQKRGQSADL